MNKINEKKESIFNNILQIVDKKIKLTDKRDGAIVSLTYELTFDTLQKYFKSELKKNYFKKNKLKSHVIHTKKLENIK